MLVSAVILAGGKSSRMQGQDKGLMLLHQQPMIAHVIARLNPQVDHIFINANRHISQYSTFNLPVINDGNLSFNGPLAGVLAALKVMKTPYLLVSACDAPLIPKDLCKQLLGAILSHHAKVAIPTDGVRLQPTFSLIHHSLLNSLEKFLANGERKFQHWVSQQNHVTVDFSAQKHAFININCPADITAFQQG